MTDQRIAHAPHHAREPREKDPVERLIELLAIDPAAIAVAASVAAMIVAIAFHAAGAVGTWCGIAAMVTLFLCLGLSTLHRQHYLQAGESKPDTEVALAKS